MNRVFQPLSVTAENSLPARRRMAATTAVRRAVMLLSVALVALPVVVSAQAVTAAATTHRSPSAAELRRAVVAESALVWRVFRDIHEHPELGKQEQRTHDVLKRELKA